MEGKYKGSEAERLAKESSKAFKIYESANKAYLAAKRLRDEALTNSFNAHRAVQVQLGLAA